MKDYLNEQFKTTFQNEPDKYLSCGGRFEVLGNHTDNQFPLLEVLLITWLITNMKSVGLIFI